VTDETTIAIIDWAARHAPDVTEAELAVSLGVSVNFVKRRTAGVDPEAGSKLRTYREIIGRLANKVYTMSELTLEEVAEEAQCSRQHLDRCRREARRG
jgi:AraC-like DNA-binding protein